jgi:hypothetical protein
VIDKPASLAAREKFELIKAEFKQWAYRDEDRRDRLLRLYNDEFNKIRERIYNGSHLLLPGMSKVVEPYKHQLDAIWRIVSGGNTMLAHIVGAGKTFTMAAAAMELRRIGKARKPCIACPNHLLEQVVGDFVRLYPNSRVLMATKEDLHGDKRREFVARIALGDWDAVVMTHSTFERLPLRPSTSTRFVKQLMDQARLAIDLAGESGAKRSVKQCEKLIKVLEAKIDRALSESDRDDFVYFDDLGVDFIMYDEAHYAKALLRISKMPTMAGLPNVSSNRAFDLWSKTSIIMEQRGGKEEGVVFATATPICNSIAELYTMQKFLKPYTLKAMGLYEFDAWAGTFGESVQSMEIAPDGSGYRLHSRFARFVNVEDLMAVVKLCFDVKTRSMINLPTPKILGGKPQTIQSPASALLKDFTDELVKRANAVRNGSVPPEEDNMLAITTSGRKAALDMRLVDHRAAFDPQGKVAQINDQVLRIWNETKERKGTQIVFCDLSTPNTSGFSVYHDLRARLIDGGIPESEIEFIHDHDTDVAKAKLFKKVRGGIVRVLFGSTDKLGVGTNVQKRLRAVHQADPPWRPDQVIQRDGRAERPGNQWDEIELLRYVTLSSFDAYTWSLLEFKARFIDQIMNSASGIRTIEDLATGALTYAEIKAIASGNPLVLEKATVDADVLRYAMLQDQWEQDRWKWSRARLRNEEVVREVSKRMDAVKADAASINAEKLAGWSFQPAGQWAPAAQVAANIEARIGAQILHVSRVMSKYGDAVVGIVGGMTLLVSRRDGVDLELHSRHGNCKYGLSRFGTLLTNIEGTGELVLDKLNQLCEEPARQTQLAEKLARENMDIENRLAADFEHRCKLTELRARQRRIDAELDLDKDEAGTEAATDAGPAAVSV